MIDRDDIVRALTAAWLVFLDRQNAIRMFDASFRGFWRSFQAIALIVPLFAVTVYVERRMLLADAVPDAAYSESGFVAAAWLSLALNWVTFPILLALLAGFLAIRQGYAAYIVARNWGAVLLAVPDTVISLLQLVAPDIADLLYFLLVASLAIALRYSYLIARRAFGVSVDVAIGFASLDLLVALGLVQGVSHAFGLATLG